MIGALASRLRSRAVLIPVAALALGCLGRSPGVQYYTLSGVPDASGSARSDVAVGVGPVTLPDYLDRPQLVTRKGGSSIEIDETSRWAGGLGSNLALALADDLGSRLGSNQIFLDPAASPTPVAFQVSVDVRQFESQDGGDLLLRARWVLRERSGEKRAWTRESTIRRDVSGGGVQALVAAHDVAVAALADEIAQQIRSAQP